MIKSEVSKSWCVAAVVYIWATRTVMSQSDTVFSLFVDAGSLGSRNFNLRTEAFIKFYKCLCSPDLGCTATSGLNDDVVSVKSCHIAGNIPPSKSCKVLNDVFCGVRGTAEELEGLTCSVTEINTIMCSSVNIMWDGTQNASVTSYSQNVDISRCGNRCLRIEAFQFQNLIEKPPETFFLSQYDIVNPHGDKTTSSTPSPTDEMHTKREDGGGEDITIIIGAAVGGIVVVAIFVIIIIILWRRKRRTSSPSATITTNKNNRNDDTDIYCYGDSSPNTAKPNLNSNNLNTNPNEPTPDMTMTTTVDPSKNLNKTKTSSDTSTVNNNNDSKSNQKKTQFSPNLDYTEININNDAVHYQRSSDANNGQRIPISETPPPLPANPSDKPKYYNTNSETGEDPRESYAKNKDKSAVNGEGAGSSPAGDPSGYEEAVLRTDTQYTTVVDPSTKNTLKPAPDGVYAKLHDPVRNITDVYNEWPAQESGGNKS